MGSILKDSEWLNNNYPLLYNYFIKDGFSIIFEKWNNIKLLRPFVTDNFELQIEIIKEVEEELQFRVLFQTIVPKEFVYSQIFIYKTNEGMDKLLESFHTDITILFKKFISLGNS
jgi:hypothetical protein